MTSNNLGNLAPYLRQAITTFHNGFESEEMEEIFLDNVFDEISGNELKIMLMKSTTCIMEKLVIAASVKNLLQLFEVFSKNMQEFFDSMHGHYAFTHSLKRIIVLCGKSKMDTYNQEWSKLIGLVVSCCENLKNSDSLMELMTNSTIMLRSLFATLGGTTTTAKKRQEVSNKKSNKACDVILTRDQIPKEFLETFDEIIKAFTAVDKVKVVELVCNSKAAPCISSMLQVASLRSSDSLDLLCSKLLSAFRKKDDWNTLMILTKDQVGSIVVDSMLDSNHPAVYERLYHLLSSEEKLIELACHPIANFVVQRLIVASTSADQFENLFDLLLNGVEDVLAEDNYGVLQKLAEQCLKTKTRQQVLLNSLLEVFHCHEADHKNLIVSLIAGFTTYDNFVTSSQIPSLHKITYHGSVLLQTLLNFDDPSIVADSFARIPLEHAVKIACDLSGSYIIDALFNSQTVKEKSKMDFLLHIQEKFPLFAKDKFANKVIWNMWGKLNMPMKILVAKSLVDHKDLSNHPIGKYVLIHLRINDFVANRKKWKQFQDQQERKRKVFADILSTDSDKSKPAKKKKKTVHSKVKSV